MGQLTDKQKQQKWEEIGLHHARVQLEHLTDAHKAKAQGLSSTESILFYIDETRRALERFRDCMQNGCDLDEFPDEFEDEEDLGEPILL